MKKFVLGFLLGALIFGAVTVMASERSIVPNPFRILVDGQERQVDAYLIDGRTFLQLRGVAELIDGVEVDFIDGEIIINTNRGVDLTTVNDTDTTLTTSDGIWITVVDGVQYIPAFMVQRPAGISWDMPTGVEGRLHLADYRGTDVVILLENIPHIVYNDLMHIPLNYYENVLRPFLEGLE